MKILSPFPRKCYIGRHPRLWGLLLNIYTGGILSQKNSFFRFFKYFLLTIPRFPQLQVWRKCLFSPPRACYNRREMRDALSGKMMGGWAAIAAGAATVAACWWLTVSMAVDFYHSSATVTMWQNASFILGQ